VRTRVDRVTLLQTLEAVQPGLSTRDIVEQSSCFVFKNGRVITYNSEVACKAPSGLPKELTGAVRAAPLLAVLQKVPDEEIEIEVGEGELLLHGKGRRRAGVRMDAEITLPVDSVERPGTWQALPEDFLEAVKFVQECASKDQSEFKLTCVHLHPKWVEASDNYQVSRYRTATGVREPVLVRKESIRHVVTLGMTEFCETETWIHFRNASKIVLSCHRHTDIEFPKYGKYFRFEGVPMGLPKSLVSAAELAGIFTEENDDDEVVVTLRPDRPMEVRGHGASGWASEEKKVKYTGPPRTFTISPRQLVEVVNRHSECVTDGNRLRVDGERWTYFTTLGTPSENGKPKKEEKADG
jgi:hypothetical protein